MCKLSQNNGIRTNGDTEAGNCNTPLSIKKVRGKCQLLYRPGMKVGFIDESY